MKTDYTDTINEKWRVGKCNAKSAEAVVWCGNIPVVAGVAVAYAEHIAEIHNAWIAGRKENGRMTEDDAKCFARTIVMMATCGDKELEEIARDILDRLYILTHNNGTAGNCGGRATCAHRA